MGEVDASYSQTLVKGRYHASRKQHTLDETAIIDACPTESEDFGHRDDVAFHAVDFLQANDPAPSVLAALDLNDDVDGGRHLRPQGLNGKLNARHRHHGLDASECVAR